MEKSGNRENGICPVRLLLPQRLAGRIAAVLTVMVAISSCSNTDSRAEKLDSLCTGTFPEERPGAAVLVMENGRTLFEKCYGIADMEKMTPITAETSFNIASVSKQFTAVAVLQLCENGNISLEDHVTDYFPEYTGLAWKDIRIKHLLDHSSGIPDIRKQLFTRQERIFGNEDMSLRYFPELDTLKFAPGTQYDYNNQAYVLCGRLIERISGEEFTQYMHNHVFVPAGMQHTVYFDPDNQGTIPEKSHGYVCKDGIWKEYDYGEETFFATKPDGGIYTSIRDFAEWEEALKCDKVLKGSTLEDAHSAHNKVSGSSFCDYQNRPCTWYGYGWFIEMPDSSDPAGQGHGKMVYHTGDNGGYKILAARYPESNSLILIFSNRNDWDRYALLQDIEAIVFD